MDTEIELNKTLMNILKDVRVLVHEFLSTGKIYGFYPGLGICNAVTISEPSTEIRSGCLDLLSDLMAEWPEFSGDPSYPVPHPDESPKRAFDHASTGDMWNPGSAYGAARLRLLDWLISKLEAET